MGIKIFGKGVIKKCVKKIQLLGKNSLGGRPTLINSVLDGIPTYTMSLCCMPATLVVSWILLENNSRCFFGK